MNIITRFKGFYILNLVLVFLSKNILASKLPETFINLNELYGEQRRQTQSLIGKRKHFNTLIDQHKYQEASTYSENILSNIYHTYQDSQTFENLKRGLQSIKAIREHFYSKIEEKEYDYALNYLNNSILIHPYHIKEDNNLIKLINRKKSAKVKGGAKNFNNFDNIDNLTELVRKNLYVNSKSYNYDRQQRGFSKQYPVQSSGATYLNYIGDLLPFQR